MTADPQPAPRSLRAVVDVLVFWTAFMVILEAPRLFLGALPAAWAKFTWGVTVTAGSLLLTLALARLQRLRPRDLGIVPGRWSAVVLLAGLVCGFAIVVLQLALVTPVLQLHVSRDPRASLKVAGAMLATFLALSAMEEVGFRGYPLRRLAGPLGIWGAQVVVAIAFGLYHRFAYGWPWGQAMIGTTLGSLLLGAAAFASRGLAAPVGIHAGINFGLWAFGDATRPGLFHMVSDAPALHGWRSQAANASYIATFVAATLAFHAWHARTNRGG